MPRREPTISEIGRQPLDRRLRVEPVGDELRNVLRWQLLDQTARCLRELIVLDFEDDLADSPPDRHIDM
jgi:hypothetical protein